MLHGNPPCLTTLSRLLGSVKTLWNLYPLFFQSRDTCWANYEEASSTGFDTNGQVTSSSTKFVMNMDERSQYLGFLDCVMYTLSFPLKNHFLTFCFQIKMRYELAMYIFFVYSLSEQLTVHSLSITIFKLTDDYLQNTCISACCFLSHFFADENQDYLTKYDSSGTRKSSFGTKYGKMLLKSPYCM